MNEIEHARSGRSKCRRCRETITKGELRFGYQTENPYGEGTSTLWFHLACAAEKLPAALVEALEASDLEIENKGQLLELGKIGASNEQLAQILGVEKAASGRAKCKHCKESIAKGALRVARENDGDLMAMPSKSFVHVTCAREFFGSEGLWAWVQRKATDLDAEAMEELKSCLAD